MKFEGISFKWYDFWVGGYFDRDEDYELARNKKIYLILIPMFPLEFSFGQHYRPGWLRQWICRRFGHPTIKRPDAIRAMDEWSAFCVRCDIAFFKDDVWYKDYNAYFNRTRKEEPDITNE